MTEFCHTSFSGCPVRRRGTWCRDHGCLFYAGPDSIPDQFHSVLLPLTDPSPTLPQGTLVPQRLPCLLAYFLNPPSTPGQGPSGPQSPVLSSVLQNPDVLSVQNMQGLKPTPQCLYSKTEINLEDPHTQTGLWASRPREE